MIGLIGAMEIEVKYFIDSLTAKKKFRYLKRDFYQGVLEGQEVVVVRAGVGKVNAAVTTSLLVENFDIDYVINTGIAGGISPAKTETLVISDKVFYSDADVTCLGYQFGQIPGEDAIFKIDTELHNLVVKAVEELKIEYKTGTIATADSFITDLIQIEKAKEIANDLIACDMEGGAIAQVCRQCDKPFVIIRTISDIIGSDEQAICYEKLELIAAKTITKIIKQILKKISKFSR